MLAKDNEFMKEAAESLYECNADDLIQEQCRARETRLFFERATQARLEELTEELTNMNATMAEKDELIAEKNAENARLKALLEEHNIPI